MRPKIQDPIGAQRFLAKHKTKLGCEENEIVYFSSRVLRLAYTGFFRKSAEWQKRILVITNKAIYKLQGNGKPSERPRVPLADIKCISHALTDITGDRPDDIDFTTAGDFCIHMRKIFDKRKENTHKDWYCRPDTSATGEERTRLGPVVAAITSALSTEFARGAIPILRTGDIKNLHRTNYTDLRDVASRIKRLVTCFYKKPEDTEEFYGMGKLPCQILSCPHRFDDPKDRAIHEMRDHSAADGYINIDMLF